MIYDRCRLKIEDFYRLFERFRETLKGVSLTFIQVKDTDILINMDYLFQYLHSRVYIFNDHLIGLNW